MWKLLNVRNLWVMVIAVVIVGVGESGICTCGSCGVCEARLEDPACSEVRMTRNIEGANCIAVEHRKDVLFNCRGYDIVSEDDYALSLWNVSNFTARDCEFAFDADVVRIVEVIKSKDVVLENITFDGVLGGFDEDTEWGAELYVENSNVTVRNSTFWQWGTIKHRSYSIQSVNSNMTIINNRVVRRNFDLDFHSEDWKASKGWDNMCKRPGTWNDTGTIGCKYWDWGVCKCWNCSDCNFKLNDEFCNKTDLTQNITVSGDCLNWGTTNIIDGGGFTIRGDGSGVGVRGRNTKNLRIENFWRGMVTPLSNITNVTITGCRDFGIRGTQVEGIRINGSRIERNARGIFAWEFEMQNSYVCNNIEYDVRSLGCIGRWTNNTCSIMRDVICNDEPINPIHGWGCYRRCWTGDPTTCETDLRAFKEYYIRDLTNVGNCFNITNLNGKIAVCVEGRIDGNDTGWAFRIDNSTNITIKGCNITQFFNAIEMHRSRNITIRDGEIHHIRRFPLLLNHSSGEIINITFYENVWARGYRNISSNFTFRDCAIILNPWCIDDPICTAALIGIIIAGLWVYYRRRV